MAYFKEAAAQYLSLFPGKDYRLASMLYNEGQVYSDKEEFAQAENVLREALSIDIAHLPALDKRTLDTRILLGETLLNEHKAADAQPFLSQAFNDAATVVCRARLSETALQKICKLSPRQRQVIALKLTTCR